MIHKDALIGKTIDHVSEWGRSVDIRFTDGTMLTVEALDVLTYSGPDTEVELWYQGETVTAEAAGHSS